MKTDQKNGTERGDRRIMLVPSYMVGKKYVMATYQQFSDFFGHKKAKKPVRIRSMDSVFSLKRLVEA